MKMMLAAMVGCLLVSHAFAADKPLSAGRMKAATALLHVLNAQKVATAGADAMVNVMIRTHPMMAPYRGVMRKWARKTLSWSRIAPKLARLYASAFTESQLHDLIRFYKTPTGQKAVREMPKLERQGAMIGARMAMRHVAELRRMIKSRAAQLQKASP